MTRLTMGEDLTTDYGYQNVQSAVNNAPRGATVFLLVRHPVYGWVSWVEPKQETTWWHGKDTRTLGFYPKQLEETSVFC